MKAIILTRYGSPDTLQLHEVEKPSPRDNQVLVRVLAASANPLDWHHMRGEPILARMGEGFLQPKNTKLGADVAGRVETVGRNVTEFQTGDEVFGVCAGSFAEYVCASETKLALKPANISFDAAAATPVAAFTALQGLRDKGEIRPGQKVLVYGASGGVGTFAVQIARSYGAEVTGVCSTRNVDMVRSIGADHVIDYTKEDFTRNGEKYDLIYDAVGNRSAFDYARALSSGGMCVITGFSSLLRLAGNVVLGAMISRAGSKQIGFQGLATTPKTDLVVIKELLAEGKVLPVIGKRFPLKEAPEAIRYLEAGHPGGKVVVTVEHNDKN